MQKSQYLLLFKPLNDSEIKDGGKITYSFCPENSTCYRYTDALVFPLERKRKYILCCKNQKQK